MAYKRKRVYATRPYRAMPGRTLKRRRFVRRRRRQMTITSKASVPRRLWWRKKKLTRNKIRRFKNALWTVSEAMNKYRVGFVSQHGMTAPSDRNTVNNLHLKIGQSNAAGTTSLTNADSWISHQGGYQPDSVGDNVIYRGGSSRITLSQENTEVIEYKIYIFKHIDKDDPPNFTAFETLRGIPPTFADNLSNDRKIIRSWQGFLENGSAVQFEFRLGLQKLDPAQYDAGVAYYWHIQLGNTFSDSATNIAVLREELHFVAGDTAPSVIDPA